MLQSHREETAEKKNCYFVVPQAAFSSQIHQHRSHLATDTYILNNITTFKKQCISKTIIAI